MKRISSWNNIKNLWALIALTTIALLLPLKMTAQNNPKGIRDELYPIFLEAEKLMQSEKGLPVAQEFYDQAVKLGDKKAQCFALYIIANIKFLCQHESPQIISELEKIKSQIKALNLNTYNSYDYVWLYEILVLLDHQHYNESLEVSQKWYDDIKGTKGNRTVGLANCYWAMGSIYYYLQNNQKAKEFFELCYDLANNTDLDDPGIWIKLTGAFHMLDNEPEKALECARNGLSKKPKLLQKLQLLFFISEVNIANNESYGAKTLEAVNNFLNLYESSRNVTTMYDPEVPRLKTIRYICLGDYAKAHEEANKIDNKVVKFGYLVDIYEKEGNWKDAYKMMLEKHNEMKKNWNNQLNNIQNLHSEDLAELNATMGNDRLRAEKAELALANSQMKFGNLQLLTEKERTLRANDLLRLQNSMTSDSLNKAKVATQSLKMKAMEEEQAHKNAVQARKDAEQRTRNVMAIFFSVLVLTIAIAALVLWRNEKKNVAKLRLSNKQLTIARNEAQESEKMKGIFVENVSHEIRTPLNAIVGFSALLTSPGMEMSDEEKQEFYDTINKNSELLTAMINDLLSLSEMGSTQKLNIADCYVNEMCRNAMMTVSNRCPKGVEMNFTTNLDDTFIMATDERRVTQVIVNFLTNAEKYTTEGTITLDCSKADGYLTFTVTDTGCGIPLDKQAKAFERFEKMGSFTQGIGLGLNICKMTAQLMNAKIGIDPKYTDGARFYFALPCPI